MTTDPVIYREIDGHLELVFPEPRRDHYQVSPEVLEQFVAFYNDALGQIHATRAYLQSRRRVENDVDGPGWTEAVWEQDAALHHLRVLLGEPCDCESG